MTRDELHRLLNLTGKASPHDEEPLDVEEDTTGPPVPPNPQALVLDTWDRLRGDTLVEESGRLRAYSTTPAEAADFHAAAFLPEPELTPKCEDPLRHNFVGKLLDDPSWRSVRSCSVLDPMLSEVATPDVAEQFKKLKEKREKTEAEKGRSPTTEETESACTVAASRAGREAAEGVERASGQREAFGMGPGSPGSNDVKSIAGLFQRIRNSEKLRRICELAGSLIFLAQGRQRRKVKHGTDDVVGVVPSDDVGRLLSSELMLLAHPATRLEGLRRLAEKESLCLDRRGTERVGKGPVIISIDSSGSMNGDKLYSAKAMALAMAWVARKQRRWCGLIDFSGDSGHLLCALPPGRWDEQKLADWLENAFGGGSNLDVPVRELPDFYTQLGSPKGKTDIVMITDAICSIPETVRIQFNTWRQSVRARVISLIIDEEPGDLAAVSDETYRVKSLSADEEAVGRVLSI